VFEPKSILVNGRVGFPGSDLCERLVAHGHDVICHDNFSQATKRNVEHLIGKPWSMSRLKRSITSPVPSRRAITSTIRWRPPRPRQAAQRILQISTSEVYGDATQHPNGRTAGATSIRCLLRRAQALRRNIVFD
jgi:dTDP-D-glucose 4,6-dehydratase